MHVPVHIPALFPHTGPTLFPHSLWCPTTVPTVTKLSPTLSPVSSTLSLCCPPLFLPMLSPLSPCCPHTLPYTVPTGPLTLSPHSPCSIPHTVPRMPPPLQPSHPSCPKSSLILSTQMLELAWMPAVSRGPGAVGRRSAWPQPRGGLTRAAFQGLCRPRAILTQQPGQEPGPSDQGASSSVRNQSDTPSGTEPSPPSHAERGWPLPSLPPCPDAPILRQRASRASGGPCSVTGRPGAEWAERKVPTCQARPEQPPASISPAVVWDSTIKDRGGTQLT